jgi:hypothetical protein
MSEQGRMPYAPAIIHRKGLVEKVHVTGEILITISC